MKLSTKFVKIDKDELDTCRNKMQWTKAGQKLCNGGTELVRFVKVASYDLDKTLYWEEKGTRMETTKMSGESLMKEGLPQIKASKSDFQEIWLAIAQCLG